MTTKKQVEIFNRVLVSIKNKYNPDIIAIACNTLSVVYYQTNFYKNDKTKVLDIINIGKSIISQVQNQTIIEVAMPTTINSKVYDEQTKNRIAVPSDVMLPDAIENAYLDKINKMINKIFVVAKYKLNEKAIPNKDLSLFLGCTHFPLIKSRFMDVAKKAGLDIQNVLDPNKAFAQWAFKESLFIEDIPKTQDISTQVISRMPLKETEVSNVALLIRKTSYELAGALKNYSLDKELF
jgi:glutamate racemase